MLCGGGGELDKWDLVLVAHSPVPSVSVFSHAGDYRELAHVYNAGDYRELAHVYNAGDYRELAHVYNAGDYRELAHVYNAGITEN